MSDTASWITFGKERYHQHLDMEQWCHKNIGVGGWHYDTPKSWAGMGNKIWSVDSTFGNTTFSFKEEKDMTMFILRWS